MLNIVYGLKIFDAICIGSMKTFTIFIFILRIKECTMMTHNLKTNCTNGSDDEKCKNGGECKNYTSSRVHYDRKGIKPIQVTFTYCKCTREYGGRTCMEDNYCFHYKPCVPKQSHECVHVSPNSFKCYCNKGWTGDRCETPKHDKIVIYERNAYSNPCRSNPCGVRGTNGRGTCKATHDDEGRYSGYFCKCKEKYTGVHCETRRDCRDANDMCKNGASCIKKPKERIFSCLCLDMYTGFRCESLLNFVLNEDEPPKKLQRMDASENPCDSNPCLNDGTCSVSFDLADNLDILVKYKCDCWELFTGPRCESEILVDLDAILCDDSELYTNRIKRQSGLQSKSAGRNPCKQGSTCLLKYDKNFISYTCLCVKGTRGKYCNVGCALGRYGAGCKKKCGNCKQKTCNYKDGRCTCLPGWDGDRCVNINAVQITMQAILEGEYTPKLRNKSSAAYRELRTIVENWVENTCVDDLEEGLECDMYRMDCSPGSVILNYQVRFKHSVLSSRFSDHLSRTFTKSAGKYFKQNTFKIIPNSISVLKIETVSSGKIESSYMRGIKITLALSLILCSAFLVFTGLLCIHRWKFNLKYMQRRKLKVDIRRK